MAYRAGRGLGSQSELGIDVRGNVGDANGSPVVKGAPATPAQAPVVGQNVSDPTLVPARRGPYILHALVPYLRYAGLTLLAVVAVCGVLAGGEWLLYRRGGGCLVVDSPLVLNSPNVVVDGTFAPDGRSLLLLTSDGRLIRRVVDRMTEISAVVLEQGRNLRGGRFLAGGAVLLPDWAPHPDELLRERRPVPPPLSWFEHLWLGPQRHRIPSLYDTASGRRLGTLEEGRNIARLDFSSDGIYIAGIRDGGHEVLIWDQRGKLLSRFRSDAPVTAVAFHPVEDTMAWLHPVKHGMQVTFHDLKTGEKRGVLEAGLARGVLLRYSPDGTRIAVGSRTMELWDPKWERRTMIYEARPPLDDVLFAPDGRTLMLVTSEMSGTHKFRRLQAAQRSPTPYASGTWLSSDWKRVADVDGGSLTVREARGGAVVSQLSQPRPQWLLGYSLTGNRFASAEPPGVVHVWDASRRHLIETVRGPVGRVVAMSRDWSSGVTQCGREFVVWNFPSGDVLRTFHPDPRYAWDFVQFTPDQRQLLFTRRDPAGTSTACTWDPDDGAVVQVLAPWTSFAPYTAVAEGPGECVVASTADEWQGYSDVERVPLWRLEAPERALRVLSDGKGTIYFVGRHGVYAVKAPSGEVTGSFHHEGVPAAPNAHVAAISPDGALLATAESEASSEIAVWHLPTMRRLATLRGHTRPAGDLAFSLDGRTLISAGQDGALFLWPVPGAPKASSHH